MICKSRLFALIGVTCAASMALSYAQAAGSKLQQYRALCESNALCSNEAMGDGTLFKMHITARTHNILCRADGNCEVLLPRGKRHKVDDVEARLSVK